MAGAGVQLTIHVDDTMLRQGIERVMARMANAQPIFDEIGQRLVTSVVHRFEREAGPHGAPWKPSRRATGAGGQTLSDTGRLRDSITHRAGADHVQVGTHIRYAAIHQFGGTIRPKKGDRLVFSVGGTKVFARAVKIPARPFLGLDASDRGTVLGVFRRHLAEA